MSQPPYTPGQQHHPQAQQYPQAPPQYAPPAPPKKSNTWKWLLGIAVGLLVLCGGGLGACAILAGGVANEVVNEQNAKRGDVKVTSCTGKPNEVLPSVEVGYTIKNSGGDKRTYIVTLAVDDAAGNRLGEGIASTVDLNPGQSTSGSSPVLLDEQASGTVRCSVLDVT